MTTAAMGKVAVVALGVAYLFLTGTLVWLMLGPPRDFPGFYRDTATQEAPLRLALYADALGRMPSTLSAHTYVWAVRGVLAALFAAHGLAILVLRRWPAPRALWLVLPVLAQVVALAYPATSADVFYYAVSGHMVTDLGGNPYRLPPAAFPDHPLLRFNYWTEVTSAYGPLWTTISAGVVAVTGTDPLRVSLAFKVLAAISGIAYAAVASCLAERIRPGTGLMAFVLVGGHPLLVIESAGTAHHEATVIVLALLGLLALTHGRVRSSLLLVTLSAVTKPVTLPLVGLVALARLAHSSWRHIIHGWAVDAAALAVLGVLVAAPYWADGALLRSIVAEPARMFVNPLYTLPANAVAAQWGGESSFVVIREAARPAAQVATVGVVVASLIWLGYRVHQDRPVGTTMLRSQLRAWVVVTVALSLLPVNAQPWYTIWALGPVAALSGERGRLLATYLAFVAFFFIANHTVVTCDADDVCGEADRGGSPASLYETFPPAETKRLADKLEVHHTP